MSKIDDKILEKARPIAANVTFGGLMGFCSGFALKKTGKAIAYLVGITFVALQIAVAYGYINVNWAKIEDDTMKKLDQVRKDGRHRKRVTVILHSPCLCLCVCVCVRVVCPAFLMYLTLPSCC